MPPNVRLPPIKVTVTASILLPIWPQNGRVCAGHRHKTAEAAQGFKLSIHEFGNAVVGLQPARGYNIDPTETYHSPDLVPPHNYLAFYFYLRHHWGADAIVHMGKHGNLEWLPGKAVALSQTCWPEAVFGATPHIYPFIVNDPGEGTQAKRRTSAVIIDHLTPPLTRAESYGPLRDLEALVDEYYEADVMHHCCALWLLILASNLIRWIVILGLGPHKNPIICCMWQTTRGAPKATLSNGATGRAACWSPRGARPICAQVVTISPKRWP